jgi:hypothetical protein
MGKNNSCVNGVLLKMTVVHMSILHYFLSTQCVFSTHHVLSLSWPDIFTLFIYPFIYLFIYSSLSFTLTLMSNICDSLKQFYPFVCSCLCFMSLSQLSEQTVLRLLFKWKHCVPRLYVFFQSLGSTGWQFSHFFNWSYVAQTCGLVLDNGLFSVVKNQDGGALFVR